MLSILLISLVDDTIALNHEEHVASPLVLGANELLRLHQQSSHVTDEVLEKRTLLSLHNWSLHKSCQFLETISVSLCDAAEASY